MIPHFNRVLVVDDCQTIRRWLKKELTTSGYSVTTAKDGVEALQLLRTQSFNYVLTDWDMPRMDGETLCRCIRGIESRYVYTMIMTAGHSDSINLMNGFAAGADDFIIKPLNSLELTARMQAGARILKLDERMSRLANHDPLTGALNRRTFISRMSKELEICRRRGQPLSCIMVDLDHFKQLNDKCGHVAGDEVLRKVAEILTQQFRAGDYVFRYGGEEFCIVLVGADEEGAHLCAERCREQIATVDFAFDQIERVTASFGVSTSLKCNEVPIRLIERADEALRQAKTNGRNQTVCHSAIVSPEITCESESGELPRQVPVV